MVILVVILFIIVIILLIYNISLKKQVKNITRYLDNLNNDRTRTKLEISLNNKHIENLAIKINDIIKYQEELDIQRSIQENKLKSFIISVSHDLRTPLTSIRGYIQLIESDNLSEEKRLKFIDIVNRKSIVLDRLINEFFELSVYDSSEYELKLDKVDFTKILSNILIENYYNFKEKNILLDINIPQEPVYILGDNIACERIIQNLISNILKYAVKKANIDISLDSKYCYLNISNHTVGLKSEDIDNLFDRFYRADKSRSSKGSGIGLYIVKLLVEKMEGSVSSKIIDGDILNIGISIPLIYT